MSKLKQLSLAAVLLASSALPILAPATPAQAALPSAVSTSCPAGSILWDGPGSNGILGNAANWVGDVLPGPSDIACIENRSS